MSPGEVVKWGGCPLEGCRRTLQTFKQSSDLFDNLFEASQEISVWSHYSKLLMWVACLSGKRQFPTGVVFFRNETHSSLEIFT